MTYVLIASQPDGTLQDAHGEARSDPVEFRQANGTAPDHYDGTLVSHYADNAGTSPLTTPITPDSKGRLMRYIAGGTYRQIVNPSDVTRRESIEFHAVPGSMASFGFLVDAPTGVAATDTAAIQTQLDAANTAGGGLVFLRYGTYVVNASLVLYSNVALRGQGRGATVISLAAAANVDLIKSYQFDSLTGGGTTGGTVMSGIAELTLDGNKANNLTSGRGWSIYGRDFVIVNVKVQNTRGLGAYSEWAASGADMEGGCSEVKFVSCTGGGWQFKGPHDMKLRAIKAESCGGTSVEVSGNGFGSHWTDCHVWGVLHTIGFDMQTQVHGTNCQAEGVQVGPQVRLLGSRTRWHGRAFGGSAASGNAAQAGVQIGWTSPLTTPGNVIVDVQVDTLSGYSFDFQSDGGGSAFRGIGVGGTLGPFNPAQAPAVTSHKEFNTGSASTSYLEARNFRGPNATALLADSGATVSGGDTITKRDNEGVKFQKADGTAVSSIHSTNGVQAHNNQNITCYTDYGTTASIRMRGTDGSIRMGSAVDRGVYSASGTPEAAITANVSSVYLRSNGGYHTALAVKATGSGNTGWVNAALRAMATNSTDAPFTLTPDTSPEHTIFTAVMAAGRVITLSTTGATAGMKFKITRTAASTGAFNLDLGGLKNIAVSQWAEVTYNGSAWVLTAFGSL